MVTNALNFFSELAVTANKEISAQTSTPAESSAPRIPSSPALASTPARGPPLPQTPVSLSVPIPETLADTNILARVQTMTTELDHIRRTLSMSESARAKLIEELSESELARAPLAKEISELQAAQGKLAQENALLDTDRNALTKELSELKNSVQLKLEEGSALAQVNFKAYEKKALKQIAENQAEISMW